MQSCNRIGLTCESRVWNFKLWYILLSLTERAMQRITHTHQIECDITQCFEFPCDILFDWTWSMPQCLMQHLGVDRGAVCSHIIIIVWISTFALQQVVCPCYELGTLESSS